jgi:hypothetical protein
MNRLKIVFLENYDLKNAENCFFKLQAIRCFFFFFFKREILNCDLKVKL